MAQFIPVTLSGDNLGKRHRHLTSLVEQTAKQLTSFQDVEHVAELSSVDRLFKIDLAIKLKNIDYILKNIKDDDMLYVSRALKCKWLLEHRDIINPKYLEETLFPMMVMPAISKMKHWLYIKLRDPYMCQEFYLYYRDINFDFAIKFLTHCDNEFVLNEFPKILDKISPHYLKVFSEKCPEFVKIYYDSLATDNELVKRYLEDEKKFCDSIKCVLKSNPDMYLGIIEKYHTLSSANKLSSSATDYILRYHKIRFTAKPELYAVYFFHLPTVAKYLSVEECQDLVIKLARARYLSWWFSYKMVEPLVKRVPRDERAAFKKQVFVEKDIGAHVTEWPYALPTSPVAKDTSFNDPHVFHDGTYAPVQMTEYGDFRAMLKKRKYAKWGEVSSKTFQMKSELQKLYDEFRFVGFEGTFHELKKKIGATSSADRRRDMLLVLVSKSGGRADAMQALLQFALRLRNEPVHERAAVVRSLVKRASAWRLPQDVWDTMLEYGRGLGLDGSKPEAECCEGLHAVVMRQLIATGDCEPAVRIAFLDKFSLLTEYKLEVNERAKISAGLQNILLTVALDSNPEEAAKHLGRLLDVLETYHIRFESSPAILAISALAERDIKSAESLLIRLYNARAGRRELLRTYLKIRHDDAALLNALRHDPDAITPEWFVELLTTGETRADRFLLKLAVYFKETGGIAEQILRLLQDKIAQKPDVKLAQPLATLAGDISSIWREQDDAGGEHSKLSAALRANMHRARPAPDALAFGWREVGMKAVAWRAMRCRPSQVAQLAQKFLEVSEKRTVRLSLILAQRTDCAAELFSIAATIRPLATLRAALLYFRKLGTSADLQIWNVIKPLLTTVDLVGRKGLCHILKNIDWVPNVIRADYCALLYIALDKSIDEKAGFEHTLYEDLMKYQPQISDDIFETVLSRLMEKIYNDIPEAYPAIVVRYLMLSKTHAEYKQRIEKTGEPYLAKINDIRLKSNDSSDEDLKKYFFSDNLEQIMTSLQYSYAFFNIKYEYCSQVIEKFLTWMQSFMPKEMYFERYVKIHATMLYYKAVRQSMKQKPEIFDDLSRKMCEGVEIVGITFGRYLAREVAQLMSQYFDSIVEIYSEGFIEYLNKYFVFEQGRETFVAGIMRGLLSESVGSEARLAARILQSQLNKQNYAIKELIAKSECKEVQFFLFA